MECRELERNGKCICCGRVILRHTDEVFRFLANKSQVGIVTICKECIVDMNKMIEEDKANE